ncbi:DNA polymerase III subunit gamma/tau [Flavobacterium sp.]|uniref:DNA polymerase III subunit gamma/tau n=1 Tax=Flavobacterium sp. TaxID=239 RepID=UPI0025DA8003|nr:DNA polymerase III subunit gamma/tau [Flavobacterium sp.]
MEVRSEENKVVLPTTNNVEVQSTKYEVQNEEHKVDEVSLSINQQPTTHNIQPATGPKPETRNPQPATVKVSALSLASIRAKKEMAEAQKSVVKEVQHLPNEPFTETEMLEQWLKYAQRMEDKGYRIVASLLTINDPILDGTTIIHELPNESSKIDFEKERPELLGYLRGKLHNHDIQIVVKVNETLVVKKAFTNQDKYNRLAEINPNLEVLKKMFDLDV